MYKRILVPTDGSAISNAGLREAVELARSQGPGVQIRILHIVEQMPMVSPQIYGPVLDQFLAQARQEGASVLAAAKGLVSEAGIAVDTQLIEALGAQAGEHVVRAAKEWAADIVVCGTHGRRGLRRIVMGSDAEFIVRRSPVPVLLVRPSGSDNP